MGRVHPDAVAVAPEPATSSSRNGGDQAAPPAVLTVWRKSLLFGCDGFTVFDARGDLAFRVDCYASSSYSSRRRRAAEVVLMAAAGQPLLTVRRASGRLAGLLGSTERWVVYDGDGTASKQPLLSVSRHASRRHHGRACTASSSSSSSSSSSKALAHVTPLADAAAASCSYVVEGSYGRRACAVRDARGGDAVAEVQRKEAVGDDVFRLVAGPRLGAPLAMALVIALDQMFARRRTARSMLRRTWSA